MNFIWGESWHACAKPNIIIIYSTFNFWIKLQFEWLLIYTFQVWNTEGKNEIKGPFNEFVTSFLQEWMTSFHCNVRQKALSPEDQSSPQRWQNRTLVVNWLDTTTELTRYPFPAQNCVEQKCQILLNQMSCCLFGSILH